MTVTAATLTTAAQTPIPVRTWPVPDSGWARLMSRSVRAPHVSDGPVDAYGNVTKVVTSIDVLPGYLEPISETEQLVEAETYRTTLQLILPAGSGVTALDTVLVDGVSYQVIEALEVVHPRTNVPHHDECRVLEIEG